jgi:hypothetical protein
MRESRNIDQVFGIFCFVFILHACTSTTPPSRPSSSPEPVHEPLKITSEPGWLPRQVPGDKHYVLLDSFVISTSTDSLQTHSSNTKAFYSLQFTRVRDSLSFLARVDSSTNSVGMSLLETAVDTGTKQEFHGGASATGQVSSLSGSSYCTRGITPAAARIFELTLSFPGRILKIGDEWIDTVSTTICRRKLLLLQQNIRRYTLTGFSIWNHHPVATIARNISSTFRTDLTNSKTAITATGTGTSQAIILADHDTGTLLESTANSELNLAITTTRGVFPFRQNVSTRIELR